jgi:hypothetical protein
MHTGGRGTLYTHSRLQKIWSQNATKHENIGPPLIFSQPPIPPLKEFKNDCASTEYSVETIFFLTRQIHDKHDRSVHGVLWNGSEAKLWTIKGV